MFKLEPIPKKRNSMEGFNLETNRSRQRSRELSGSRTRWRDNPRGGIIIGCFSGLETGREKYEAPHVLSQTVSAHARLMLHLAHVHYEHWLINEARLYPARRATRNRSARPRYLLMNRNKRFIGRAASDVLAPNHGYCVFLSPVATFLAAAT